MLLAADAVASSLQAGFNLLMPAKIYLNSASHKCQLSEIQPLANIGSWTVSHQQTYMGGQVLRVMGDAHAQLVMLNESTIGALMRILPN